MKTRTAKTQIALTIGRRPFRGSHLPIAAGRFATLTADAMDDFIATSGLLPRLDRAGALEAWQQAAAEMRSACFAGPNPRADLAALTAGDVLTQMSEASKIAFTRTVGYWARR